MTDGWITVIAVLLAGVVGGMWSHYGRKHKVPTLVSFLGAVGSGILIGLLANLLLH
jgi:hypothetical protein